MLIFTDPSRDTISLYVKYDQNIPILNRPLMSTHFIPGFWRLRFANHQSTPVNIVQVVSKYPLDVKDDSNEPMDILGVPYSF